MPLFGVIFLSLRAKNLVSKVDNIFSPPSLVPHNLNFMGSFLKDFFLFNQHLVILKDVTYSIMSELLQFMYQGEVNVKQAELQSFMGIAESLQIKGLATSGNGGAAKNTDAINSTSTSSFNQFHSNAGFTRNHPQHQLNSLGNNNENHRQTTSTPLSTASSLDNNSTMGLKGNINFKLFETFNLT